MRLVDVDKTNLPIMQREDGEWVFRFTLKEMLDFLPTVAAIPVKWIENWVKETYPITEDWKDYMVSFGELIEAWEKENE